jgi:hypothetical protein
MRNGFRECGDANKKKDDNMFFKTNTRKCVGVYKPIGIKLRGTVDYLVNHCHYILAN